MFLQNLELSEFRAFQTAAMEFPAAGVMVVAGANNTGKSTLLSALDVVRGDYGVAGSLTRHAAATSPARIRARFELTGEERERLLERVEDQQRVRRSNSLTWLEWHFVQLRRVRCRRLSCTRSGGVAASRSCRFGSTMQAA